MSKNINKIEPRVLNEIDRKIRETSESISLLEDIADKFDELSKLADTFRDQLYEIKKNDYTEYLYNEYESLSAACDDLEYENEDLQDKLAEQENHIVSLEMSVSDLEEEKSRLIGENGDLRRQLDDPITDK